MDVDERPVDQIVNDIERVGELLRPTLQLSDHLGNTLPAVLVSPLVARRLIFVDQTRIEQHPHTVPCGIEDAPILFGQGCGKIGVPLPFARSGERRQNIIGAPKDFMAIESEQDRHGRWCWFGLQVRL
jgi:hypothetical protein